MSKVRKPLSPHQFIKLGVEFYVCHCRFPSLLLSLEWDLIFSTQSITILFKIGRHAGFFPREDGRTAAAPPDDDARGSLY